MYELDLGSLWRDGETELLFTYACTRASRHTDYSAVDLFEVVVALGLEASLALSQDDLSWLTPGTTAYLS